MLTPVYDVNLQKDLLRTVDYGLADNTNGRIVDGLGSNVIQPIEDGKEPFRSQEELYKAYLNEIDQQS